MASRARDLTYDGGHLKGRFEVGWRNVVLWILQVALGIYFIYVGVMHFIVPDGLPGPMEWMYDLNDTAHAIAGTAEILGGLGLILPSVTRIRPELTVYAAVGLMIVMISALVWHATRGEGASIGFNIGNTVLLGTVAYGRWRLEPIEPRT